MKISYLGIDNTYRDGAISAGAYTTDPKVIAKLDFATEALRRWAQKYPNDPQLPRSYFLAVQVLRKVYTQPEQQLSWRLHPIADHEVSQLVLRKNDGRELEERLHAALVRVDASLPDAVASGRDAG